MPLVTQFETPARLRDFPAGSPFYENWHRLVSGMLGIGSSGPVTGGGFFNASSMEVRPAGERKLVWMGFPRQLFVADHAGGPMEAFRLGEVRGANPPGRQTQVEYLEWFVSRGKTGAITRVTFTTETPEYWQSLFDADPNRVVELYQELHHEPSISLADITDPTGAYNPLNDWNTTKGIVHYIVNSPANTLAAALGLAAGAASPPRVDDNFDITGMAATSADPKVHLDVRGLIRQPLWVTAAEPIGIYIAGWDDTGWTRPDGSPVENYWRVVRPSGGSGPPALRLEYEVPSSEGFNVSQISIGGRPIRYGGQIAEHVSVLVTGLAGVVT